MTIMHHLARLLRTDLRDDPIEPMGTVKPPVIQPTGQHDREAQPQQLGPNQLAWLENRHIFFGIHRRQAEAQTGVAAVNSGEVKT